MPERISSDDLRWLKGLSDLAYCNPFTPARIEIERGLLNERFDEREAHWNLQGVAAEIPKNTLTIIDRANESVVRVGKSPPATPPLRDLYVDAVLFLLYHRHIPNFEARIRGPGSDAPSRLFGFYREFTRGYETALRHVQEDVEKAAAHHFACFFQIRRAFHEIFLHIQGRSPAIARLRARVWESIFTADMRRYQRALYDRMGEYPSLVIGPSGSGKELVARAIARSMFIPFDLGTLRFESDFQTAFIPINLSAFSPSLLESELFGHRRGSFTGALQDRSGWLESSTARDTVFLDEIGDVAAEIQVKLLRVIEDRRFHRLGENEEKKFSGKIIGATNRDLGTAVASGRFRADFYYRLCGDVIETPGLAERFASSSEEREVLALFLARRLVGGTEAPRLAAEAVRWVERNLPNDYPWPGNVREFEQCIRNILIRGCYTPLRPGGSQPPAESPHRVLTADEMLRKYCSEIHSRTGSYETTAALLGIDRRTVKKYVTY